MQLPSIFYPHSAWPHPDWEKNSVGTVLKTACRNRYQWCIRRSETGAFTLDKITGDISVSTDLHRDSARELAQERKGGVESTLCYMLCGHPLNHGTLHQGSSSAKEHSLLHCGR